jgi:hypothetical protein
MNYPLISEYVEAIKLDATITTPNTSTINYRKR